MILLWKLLRKHINISQIIGFSVANLIGMFIMLLSIQVYEDIYPIFASKDNLFASEYLVVSKRFSTASSIFSIKDNSHFTSNEIEEIKQQNFAESVAPFTTSHYKVGCYISIDGTPTIGTDMFFESVPDKYIDVDMEKWKWSEERDEVPIVLPRSYLAIYNFGFAPTRSLPKLDEKLISRIGLTLVVRGNGMTSRMKGRVVGFTNKLNTILVPQSFMLWSNSKYSTEKEYPANRLIVSVINPADESIAQFMAEQDYEIENDKLNNSKSTYLLRIAAGTIMIVGMLITLLSFYVLMLSIYLLIEKNAYKLQNLLLIGYSRKKVALPYQLLSVSVNAIVLFIAFILMLQTRDIYIDLLDDVFPIHNHATLNISIIAAISLFVFISSLNIIIIYQKIKKF